MNIKRDITQQRVVVLGSTGSIGRNVLRVVESFPERFAIVGLGANQNIELLAEQVKKHAVRTVSLQDVERAHALRRLIGDTADIEVLEGEDGLVELASMDGTDILVSAVVGAVGLNPVLKGIDRGIRIATANKEALVMAGQIVMERARKSGAQVVPIDSEHSAVFQCLYDTPVHAVRRIILTASGGPFYGKSQAELRDVTPAEALAHPTWRMGPKISVDSATLMNKGFEVIEAMWLFGIDIDKIEVLIHPESVVHSLVEFVDGSVVAQMASTDMKLPIQYALTYPERLPTPFEILSLADVGKLTFARPEPNMFPCLDYAYRAAQEKGTMPAALNAANEVAVAAFLREDIGFTDIPEVIREVLDKHRNITEPNLEEVGKADQEARALVLTAIADATK